jgi:hypothetical protein
MAAHQLHRETVRWEEQGNELVAAAKKLAVLFAKIARFMRYVWFCLYRDNSIRSSPVRKYISRWEQQYLKIFTRKASFGLLSYVHTQKSHIL